MKGEKGGYIPAWLLMKFVKKLILCLCLSALTLGFCKLALPMEEGKVYDSVIRLHILANSDSRYDQDLKLLVRDEILASDCFEDSDSVEDAKLKLEDAAKRAVKAANACLEREGAPYRADYRLGKEVYPTREYENIRLPSGEYLSLRIVLGEGEGANWWCVAFPPLCTAAATESLDVKSGEVFDTKKSGYVFRFKLLEWFHR